MSPKSKSSPRAGATTLFARLGGARALTAVVDAFYERLLSDDELAGYFAATDLAALKRSVVAFLGQAFGGPRGYHGPALRAAHAALAIPHAHFEAAAAHLQAALEDAGVADKLVAEVMTAVAKLEPAIVVEGSSGARTGAQAGPDYRALLSAVESAPTHIILADAAFKITYMNPASRETLAKVAKYLPVTVDQIVGKSIDIFHRRPEHQRAIVADASRLPHRATIELGPEKMELLVSAIVGADGKRVGTIVTWELVTERLKLADEAARIRDMLEQMNLNVIFADQEFTIRYMNPASVRTLKPLEAHLPCRVEEIVGKSIDIFHQRPEQTRNVVAGVKQMHRANIRLGPEIVELNVSPVTDARGARVGSMVTWAVVTERFLLEQHLPVIGSVQATVEMRMDGTVETANENFLRLMGYSLEEVRGKHHSTFVGPQQAASAEYREFWAKLNRGEAQTGEYRRFARDGHEVWIQAIYAPLVDQAGKPAKVVKFASDITAAVQVREGVKAGVVAISGTTTSLSGASEEMSATSQTLAATAEETAVQANAVSGASQQVSQNLQAVASSAEQMNESIREISTNTTEASKVASAAVAVATSTNATVRKLGESSAEIGKVIKVITSIAQQTNLLALNATIEAARAGEAGKGFAVVANEVKELAKETAKATEDISQKIEAIQTDTKGAVDAIAEISQIINRINEIQTAIAAAVEEQTATTNEIGRSVGIASKGADEIAENISGVAKAAEDTARGATDINKASAELAHMATDLQDAVNRLTGNTEN